MGSTTSHTVFKPLKTGPETPEGRPAPAAMGDEVKFFPLQGKTVGGKPFKMRLNGYITTDMGGWECRYFTQEEENMPVEGNDTCLPETRVGFDKDGHLRVQDGKGEFHGCYVGDGYYQSFPLMTTFCGGQSKTDSSFKLLPDGTIQLQLNPSCRLGLVDKLETDSLKENIGVLHMVEPHDDRVVVFDTPLQENHVKKLEKNEWVLPLLQPAFPKLPGWETVTPSQLELKNVSGMGGAMTFIVKNTALDQRVILKDHNMAFVDGERSQKINDLLEGAKLVPAKIYQSDYGIWEDAGTDLASQPEEEMLPKVTSLIAAMHSTDITWYEPFRAEVIERYPFAKDTHHGSGFWQLCAMEFDKGLPLEAVKGIAEFPVPEPLSKAGRRVATSHGDFHGRNVMQNKSGTLHLIDMDFVCPIYAMYDLGYHFMQSGYFWEYTDYEKQLTKPNKAKEELRRKFCKLYLEALGSDFCSDEEVELLLYDTSCSCATYSWKGLWTVQPGAPIEDIMKVLGEFVKISEEAKTNKEIRDKVIAYGNMWPYIWHDVMGNK